MLQLLRTRLSHRAQLRFAGSNIACGVYPVGCVSRNGGRIELCFRPCGPCPLPLHLNLSPLPQAAQDGGPLSACEGRTEQGPTRLRHGNLQRQLMPAGAHLPPRLAEDVQHLRLLVAQLEGLELVVEKDEAGHVLQHLRLLVAAPVLLADQPRHRRRLGRAEAAADAHRRREVRLPRLQEGPPAQVAGLRHGVRAARHLPPAEVLRPDGHLEDRGGGGRAQREVVRHLLRVVELVRRLAPVLDAGVGVLGVRFVDERDCRFVVAGCHGEAGEGDADVSPVLLWGAGVKAEVW